MAKSIEDKSIEEKTVVETGQQARQGAWGRPVLIVLVVALILAAIAWAIAEFYGEQIDDNATTAGIVSIDVPPLRG